MEMLRDREGSMNIILVLILISYLHPNKMHHGLGILKAK
jgi:hypothetical protein